MKLIAAVDRNWAIGNRGQLLVTIPADQKRFRDMTLGKVIVMGRKTLESLPGGRPLYGRTNLVMTRDPEYQMKDARICYSLEQAMEYLAAIPPDDCFIIGGQTIYQQFLPFCDEIFVTWVDYEYEADTWFPNLDQEKDWELAERSEEQTCFDLCYEFRLYQRKQP